MSDLTSELKAAVAEMDRTSKSLATAADNVVITAPNPPTTTSTTPVQAAAPPPPVVTPTPLNSPGLEQAREAQQAKDALTDAITSAA
ncbi:hypothetical protein RBA10_22510, partial [Mycobacteroides abscessus subsp. abscessus]